MQPKLSIVIKTFNEAAKIGRTLDSVVRAIDALPFEVEIILADSCSTDDTVAIARRYPVRIVQFQHPEERGCGAGVQLGYQFARGELIYFLDGDMELQPDYLPKAIAALEQDSQLAGVAGLLEDTRVRNLVDQVRQRNKLSTREGHVPFLNGGGLYRRSAIEQAGGYAADRNLKAYEEADLGLRLTAAGYHLARLPDLAALHTGHDMDAVELMRRHWKSRRAMAAGVFLRGAIGQRHLPGVIQEFKLSLITLLIWLGGLLTAILTQDLRWMLAPALVFACAFILLTLLKKSVRHAVFSVSAWHYTLAAILVGLTYPRRPPNQRIESREAVEGI